MSAPSWTCAPTCKDFVRQTPTACRAMLICWMRRTSPAHPLRLDRVGHALSEVFRSASEQRAGLQVPPGIPAPISPHVRVRLPVDLRGIEPLPSGCRPDVLPLAPKAQMLPQSLFRLQSPRGHRGEHLSKAGITAPGGRSCWRAVHVEPCDWVMSENPAAIVSDYPAALLFCVCLPKAIPCTATAGQSFTSLETCGQTHFLG